MKYRKFSLRRRQVMAMGAGALAAPVVAMAAHEPAVYQAGDKMVVSGRIVDDADGQALSGATVEIWQADARGVRAENTRAVAITDGDGRYFAAMTATRAEHLHYRVSHPGYTPRVTKMHAAGMRQRSVTVTRDNTGSMRAAFELTLAPRNALTTALPDYVAL